MFDSRRFAKNLEYLLVATKGGPMRARIMAALIEKPDNPHMLSKRLGVDYKTVTHHLTVLRKYNWVTSGDGEYGGIYHPAFTDEQEAAFAATLAKIWKKP